MTFTEIVTEILAQCNLTSSEATTRVGRKVNRAYKRLTASIGLNVTRRTQVQATVTQGVQTLTFTGIEKVLAVIDRSTGVDRFLDEVTVEELKQTGAIGTGLATRYAIYRMNAGTVTVLLDTVPQDADTYYADGYVLASTLSGLQEPAFPESFHDILVERVCADEWKKKGELGLAKDADDAAEDLAGDLRLFIAKSAMQDIYQGKMAGSGIGGAGTTGGGSGSAPNGATSWTQTGLITFDRDPLAPFAVTAGSAPVENLFSLEEDAVSIKAYGAVCDGVSNDNTAILAAIAAGHKRIFLPANTFWTPAANTITGGIEYIGEDWDSVVIKASNPTTQYITVGAKTSLKNVGIWDKVGVDNVAANPDGATNAARPVRDLQNLSQSGQIFSHYAYTGNVYWVGDDATDDRGAISIIERGVGDGIFVSSNDDAVGIRVWISSGDATQDPTGVLLENFGDGNALRIVGNAGGVPSTGQIYVLCGSDAPGLNVVPSVNTANDIIVSHSAKTAGQMIQLFHSTTAYSGTPIYLNMATGSGSFSGNFLDCRVNSVSKAAIKSTGQYTGPTFEYVGSTATGTQNNWAPGLVGNTMIQWSGGSDIIVTGFEDGVLGQVIHFVNTGAFKAFFSHDTGSTSGAGGNRLFNAVTAANTIVFTGGYATYQYNGTFWVLINHDQGAYITPAYDDAHFTGDGVAADWTVDSGNRTTMAFKLTGKTLDVVFEIVSSDAANTPTVLGITNGQWGGFTATKAISTLGAAIDNAGTREACVIGVAAGGTVISIALLDQTDFANSTNNTHAKGSISFEVT